MSQERDIAASLGDDLFTDNHFFGGKALYREASRPPEGALPAKVVKWKRPSEFAAKPQLFLDGVAPGDVIQGTLGDCWFLGALSVIALHEELLNKLFLSTKYSKQGMYTMQFFKEGEWVEVVIDDRLPCDVLGKPIYATCRDPNEIWVMLLEKAYAKLHGSYEALMGGSAEYALRDLTGGNATKIDLTPDIANNDLWRDLLVKKDRGVLFGCAFVDTSGGVEEETAQGILKNHCYGVLELRDFEGEKLLKVRNPWGEKEWTGRWSDSSSEWTPARRKALRATMANDGTFWMCLEDFAVEFNTINVCEVFPDSYCALRTKGEWKGESAAGNFQLATWCKNPQYTLVVKEKSTVTIIVDQPDARMQPGPNWNECKANICYVLCRDLDQKDFIKALSQENFVGLSGQFLPVRQGTKTWELDRGHYIIIPCTYHPGKESWFVISVFSNRPVTLEDSERVPQAEVPINDASAAELPEPPTVAEVPPDEEDSTGQPTSVDSLIETIANLAERLSFLEETVAGMKEPKLKSRKWMLE